MEESAALDITGDQDRMLSNQRVPLNGGTN